MPSLLFLASSGLNGLFDVVPTTATKVAFIPTAGRLEQHASWIEDDRTWFRNNGFAVQELELAEASMLDIQFTLQRSDLVYVAGGNTFYLLDVVNRSGFREVMAEWDGIYAGGSAGAVIACPDIAYVESLDDRSVVPALQSTAGLSFVNFAILPHIDDADFGPKCKQVADSWQGPQELVVLRDDQAVVVEDQQCRVINSPSTT